MIVGEDHCPCSFRCWHWLTRLTVLFTSALLIATAPKCKLQMQLQMSSSANQPSSRPASQSVRQEAVLVAVRAKLVNCQSELLSWFAYYAKVFVVPETFTFARPFVPSSSCPFVHPSVRSWVIKTLKDASGRDKSCFSLFTWSALCCLVGRGCCCCCCDALMRQNLAKYQQQQHQLGIYCLSCHSNVEPSFYPYTFH